MTTPPKVSTLAEAQARGMRFLSLRKATERVPRNKRTITRWIAEGLRSQMFEGNRYVLEEDLLSWWRDKLVAEKRGQFVAGGHRVRGDE